MHLRVISSLLLINLASISYARSECDQLAALEADPLSVSAPVKFADLKAEKVIAACSEAIITCLLYTSPSPRDQRGSRMPSSA